MEVLVGLKVGHSRTRERNTVGPRERDTAGPGRGTQ